MAIRYEWHEGGMNMSLEGDWVAHVDYSAERADAQAEIARLRGALESARSYGSESWATWLISEVDDALDTK